MDKAIKADDGKARYDLIPGGPLEDLAQVYTMGAKKYADRNWEKGLSWSRVFAAIMRHLWAFWRGEDRDKESGLPHVIHAAWGCFAIAEYMKTKRELDDRQTQPPDKRVSDGVCSLCEYSAFAWLGAQRLCRQHFHDATAKISQLLVPATTISWRFSKSTVPGAPGLVYQVPEHLQQRQESERQSGRHGIGL